MSQVIAPYWVDNVARPPLLPKYLNTGPDDTANQYGSMPVHTPLAKVLPLIAPKKEDAPQAHALDHLRPAYHPLPGTRCC